MIIRQELNIYIGNQPVHVSYVVYNSCVDKYYHFGKQCWLKYDIGLLSDFIATKEECDKVVKEYLGEHKTSNIEDLKRGQIFMYCGDQFEYIGYLNGFNIFVALRGNSPTYFIDGKIVVTLV